MRTVNLTEAKTHLSRLVSAANGEPFIIARAGKPLVKVVAVDSPVSAARRRTGFLKRMIKVPPDFNRMGTDEIEGLFEGDS